MKFNVLLNTVVHVSKMCKMSYFCVMVWHETGNDNFNIFIEDNPTTFIIIGMEGRKNDCLQFFNINDLAYRVEGCLGTETEHLVNYKNNQAFVTYFFGL